MDYQPQPIETSTVQFSAELTALLERLAENTHDLWARQRLDEGWTPGTQHDTSARHHPNLVPYQELHEAQKDVDRAVVQGTLGALIALGYRILPPAEDNPRYDS